MRVAVIGAGISGLACAWRLAQHGAAIDATLFEANGYFGGHANTVDISLDGMTHAVDTGFLVFNHRTYPHLVALFEELGVPTTETDMSFSVSLADHALEWAGTSLNTVFAQRRNLLRPMFLRMLLDIPRFNRAATAMALGHCDSTLPSEPVGRFLERERFSAAFRDGYLLPMIGAIWSCPVAQMLGFPIGTLARFCHNHGLLQIAGRPRWRTVTGGAREYVARMLGEIPDARAGDAVHSVRRATRHGEPCVQVQSARGTEMFDHVVLACHSDETLALLADASPAERATLGAIRYLPNRAVLHTDAALLPMKRAWSAWNYESRNTQGDTQVCVHYLINRLQPLPFHTPVIVSLNPVREPRAERVIREFAYSHPLFDQAAIHAQRALPSLQGERNTWFAGAWTGYGFHEDGLKSGLSAATSLTERAAASERAELVT
ncbi:amine oxidase [Caballeronia choica]|uniref:Amine oxidase n=1 Tax=Caballeronia choica TaxID=326476 RepID=A0A158JKA3_9BURK|nr:FAD-dependent oxidoreductase [Caballeronia choica]SAL69322.1 amine oxidase [Caballeronia choica]